MRAKPMRFQCRRCEGAGSIHEEYMEGATYHEDPCQSCEGTGIDKRAQLNDAAPDLLEACKAALRNLMDPELGQRDTLKLILDAIAKAEGK